MTSPGSGRRASCLPFFPDMPFLEPNGAANAFPVVRVPAVFGVAPTFTLGLASEFSYSISSARDNEVNRP